MLEMDAYLSIWTKPFTILGENSKYKLTNKEIVQAKIICAG
jgi:hypothetical protein